MYWEEPNDHSSNYGSSDAYRAERNVQRAVLELTTTLSGISSALDRVVDTLGDNTTALNVIATAISSPSGESTSVIERAYARMVIAEHRRLVSSLKELHAQLASGSVSPDYVKEALVGILLKED
jgi:hypothetical protein